MAKVTFIKLDYNEWGETVLHSAVENNNLRETKRLLSQGADPNVKHRFTFETPLFVAALNNVNDKYFEVIELLLKSGADVNARNSYELSPLHYLIKNCDVKMLQLFLNYEVDVNVICSGGCNLLYPAAIYNKNLEVLQMLIDRGLNVNHRNYEGRTPLHSVANRSFDGSYLEVAELLLKNGADVDARDKQGRKPLHLVMEAGDFKTIKLLLNFKADVNAEKDDGETVLMQAILLNGKIKSAQQLVSFCKIILALVKRGANLHAVDRQGRTPLIETVFLLSLHDIHSIKIIKKYFSLVLDHIAFNKDFNLVHILAFKKDWIWKTVVEHLVKLETLNVPVHQNLYSSIHNDDKFSNYYKQCQEEMLLAKHTKVGKSRYHFYDLLVDKKKLINFTGKKSLIKDFDNYMWEDKFFIYGTKMETNVKKGIKRRVLFDQSALTLSCCLPIFNTKHVIIRDILDYFRSKKDLSKLSIGD